MEVIRRKLQDQRGEISLRLCLILLVTVLLFLIVLNVRHVYQVIDVVIDRTNEAVLAVAAYNGPGSAGGVREGEAVARRYTGADWRRAVTTTAVLDAMQRSLGGTVTGHSLVREGNYRIDNITVSYVNQDGNHLNFTTNMDISITLLVGDGTLEVGRHLEVSTTYESKF